MPAIHALEPSDADEETREIYADFQRRMGFPAPPNFIKTQGHSVDVARGTWGVVQNVLVGGRLPRSVKEMMFSAISRDRGCEYCEAAHLACCRMLGVDPTNIEQVVDDIDKITPAKLRDLVAFSVKCARSPRALEEADFASLRQHGLGQAEILEVIAMSALAVYANTIADATGMEADSMFTDF